MYHSPPNVIGFRQWHTGRFESCRRNRPEWAEKGKEKMERVIRVIYKQKGETVEARFDGFYPIDDYMNAVSMTVDPPTEFLVKIEKAAHRLPEVP